MSQYNTPPAQPGYRIPQSHQQQFYPPNQQYNARQYSPQRAQTQPVQQPQQYAQSYQHQPQYSQPQYSQYSQQQPQYTQQAAQYHHQQPQQYTQPQQPQQPQQLHRANSAQSLQQQYQYPYSPQPPPAQYSPQVQQQPQYANHAHTRSVPNGSYIQSPPQQARPSFFPPPRSPSSTFQPPNVSSVPPPMSRTGSLPPASRNVFPPSPQQPQPPVSAFSYHQTASPHTASPQGSPIAGSPTRSGSASPTRRPLPTPGPNARPTTTPSKHQSIDLSRFPTSSFPSNVPSSFNHQAASIARTAIQLKQQPEPEPVKRRSSPPRFGSNNPPSPHKDYSSLPSPSKPTPMVPTTNVGRDPLPGAGQKFVPLWKRSSQIASAVVDNEQSRPQTSTTSIAIMSPTSSSGRPLPTAPGARTTSPVRSPYTVTRRKSATARPGQARPPSRGRPRTIHDAVAAEDDEDDEDEDDEDEPQPIAVRSQKNHARTSRDEPPPSPQYGILDLPRRMAGGNSLPGGPLPQPPPMTTTRSLPPQPSSGGSSFSTRSGFGASGTSSNSRPPQPPAMSRFGIGQSLPDGGGGSMTLKFASMSMDGGGPSSPSSSFSGSGFTGSSSSQGWPANLPRLPKTPASAHGPGSGFTTTSSSGYLNRSGTRQVDELDDPPPSSFRKTPVINSGAGGGNSNGRADGPWQHQQHQPQRAQPQPRPAIQTSSYGPDRRHPPAEVEPPTVKIESPAPLGGRDKMADIPMISFPDDDEDDGPPQIQISVSPSDSNPPPPAIVFDVPGISIDTGGDDGGVPSISLPGGDHSGGGSKSKAASSVHQRPIYRGNGLICGGCGGAIIGKIVAAMGIKWHPQCFKCTVCEELLEHVSSYEHDGRPYCHLDYHENFAPKCYHCKTAIIEERFISLDDPALGKRTYHEAHFFCSECGDPFMDMSVAAASARTGELSITGDGVFADDDVGFVVYKGYPYCEACHVRLRLPRCKKCKKSIRDHMQAVEALGGKWCWECFVCASCERPFEDPSFFQRDDKPYCEQCFSIILRNEV